MDILEEKAQLREKMLDLRKVFSPKEKRHYDQSICEKLKNKISSSQAKVVHAYLPIKAEININPLLKWLINQNIKVVCPKVLPKRQLENIELLQMDHFEHGPFNTIHPASGISYNGLIDFVIMPGLAFDNDLNRLGYGGGYYDRFLVKHPGAFKAAILYPFQLVKKVPTEKHDVKMNELIIS